jgi:hypothetical protein
MMSSRLHVSVASIALMGAVGCRFDAPSFEGTNFRCEPPGERCPDGFTCEAGVCVPEGGDVDAMPDDADPPPGDGVDAPTVIDLTPTFGERPDAEFRGVTEDSTLDEDNPLPPNGGDPAVDIDSGPVKVGLIRFDLSALPPTAIVTAAELEVTIFDPLENGTFEGYLVLESWNELTTTWDLRITGLAWMGPGVTGASRGARIAMFAPRNNGTATVALSPSAVQAWIASPPTNRGIVWISTSTDGRGGQFYSSEHPVELQRPILRLTLAP